MALAAYLAELHGSNCKTGPVLVARHWLDADSVRKHRDELKEGYLPSMPFNKVLELALDLAGLTRADLYLTQAFHLLPHERSESIPQRHIDASFAERLSNASGGRLADGLVALTDAKEAS